MKNTKWSWKRSKKEEERPGRTASSGVIIEQGGRVVIPRDEGLRAQVILEAYEPPFCGHLGIKKTTEQVGRTVVVAFVERRRPGEWSKHATYVNEEL